MTTKELISLIASATSATKTHTEDLLNATTAILQKELLTGKTVQLQGFGALEMKRKSSRDIVHPKTGEKTHIPEKMQLTFKPNTTIKEKLKNL